MPVMPVMVDTSIWIEYFRKGNCSETLDFLIEEDLVVLNELILAELIPPLRLRNQQEIIRLLMSVKSYNLAINWDQIIDFQCKCLKAGINGIGIPDLLIAQNARQNRYEIYTLDNHFRLIQDILNIQILTVHESD